MAIGVLSWLAPSLAARIFGLEPEGRQPIVTQLFGAREFALGLATATSSGAARRRVLGIGVMIDVVDTVASIRQVRAGNFSTQAKILTAGGAAFFAALGAVALASEDDPARGWCRAQPCRRAVAQRHLTKRSMSGDDPLEDFDARPITLDGVTKVVRVAGAGPAVIVMPEMPGISPQVARFSRWVRDAGFTVYMPSLFGRDGAVPGADEGTAVFQRACVSAEFSAFASNRSSPVTVWLRSLAGLAHQECGGPGVGAIGMCFTGNFALTMMLEPAMLAPVLSQPSLPLDDPGGLEIASDELAAVRRRLDEDDLTVMAYRFEGDRFCRGRGGPAHDRRARRDPVVLRHAARALTPTALRRRHAYRDLRLRRRPLGYGSELLHHRHRVEDAPMLAREPIVAEPQDVDQRHFDALARRSESHELALVSPGGLRAHDDLVAARDHVLRVHPHVRERRPVHPEELERAVLGRREPRCLLVLDEVVGQHGAETVDVSGADQVVEAPSGGGVVHHLLLRSGGIRLSQNESGRGNPRTCGSRWGRTRLRRAGLFRSADSGEEPVMVRDGLALTDGGIETVLVFHEGFDLPCFASFPLLEDDRGRAAMRRYFEPFLDTARQRDLPFVLDTATWRANPDWGAQLGYDTDRLAAVNRRAVEFAGELAGGRSDVMINGVLGPRGDGYVVGEQMSADEATSYHSWQIGVLGEAGVARISALTLTYADEAIGVVQAAAAVGVPVVPSFTVETDGRLPDGTSIADAIVQVDDATGGAAEFFMVNCAHPTHIAAGLDGGPALKRVGGLRVNASALSHAELDEAEELDEGDPAALGRDNASLRDLLPSIRVLGGCCGTDHRHVAEIVTAWDGG